MTAVVVIGADVVDVVNVVDGGDVVDGAGAMVVAPTQPSRGGLGGF